ncbi:MAG: penicillin-binding protein [Actinobacteria bacterium]|nr:penicillin-binding protein [Actinomycetota bacterium]
MRSLLRRVVLVGTSAVLAVTALVALFAWLALTIQWRVPDPGALSGPTEMQSRDGTVIARFTSEVDRRIIPFEAMSPDLVAAVVANEDQRFYEHDGVDPFSLLRAIVMNVRTGGISQGGSTLTQQYVKNAFVGSDRTFLRKMREAVISIQLERDLEKEQILERYLNTVYFGEGAYGAEAAALTYFGMPASELDVARGALLAQLLPAPSTRNPRADPDGADRRADAIVRKMEALGSISSSEAAAAVAQDVEIMPRQREAFQAPYFVEYVRKQLEEAYGRQMVMTGALTVRTTISLPAQRHLDEAVENQLLSKDPGEVRAGAVAIDPRTGHILAIHGGPDFAAQQLDLATQGRRQNGSTFKPIAFIAALEEGVDPMARYPSPGRTTITADNCDAYEGEPRAVGGGPGGRLPLREALTRSVNTVFIRVGCDLGPERIIEQGLRMGVRNRIDPFVSVALGGSTNGASVLDMASAFGTIANDGVYCAARSVISVTGPDGEALPLPREVTIVPGMDPRPRSLTSVELEARPADLAERDGDGCVGAVDADIARTTTQALKEVVARTTGQRAQIGRPQAGKTGTTNDEKDAWFVGYTPDLSLAVWVGEPGTGGESVDPMRNVAGFRRVQGGTIPALIWKDAAEDLLADVPPSDFLLPGELTPEDDVARPAPARDRTREDAGDDGGPDDIPTEDTGGGTEPDEEPTDDRTDPSDDGGDGDGGGGGDDPDGGGDGGGGGDDDDDCLIVIGDC